MQGETTNLGSKGGFEYLKTPYEDVISQAGPVSECTGEQATIGGGGSISGPGTDVALNSTNPTTGDGAGWHATGRSTGDPAKVVSYAICDDAPHGWSNGTSPVDAAGGLSDILTLSDSCIADAILAGVAGGNGSVRIVRSRPVNAVNWTSSVQNHGDIASDGTQFYTCPQLELVYPKESIRVAPGKAGKVTARCPAGTAAIHGGLDSKTAGEPARDTWATATRPFDSKDNGKTPEDGWTVKSHNGSAGTVKVAAIAVCAEI